MFNQLLFYALLFAVTGAPFYFQARAHTLIEINRLSARLSALILGSLFFMNFFTGMTSKTSSENLLSFGACFFSFYLLYAFRAKKIAAIREIQTTPQENFKKSFRSLLALVTTYGLYYSVYRGLLPVLGIIPSVILAIASLVYATPLLVRMWLPTQKASASALKDALFSVFQQAKCPIYEIYWVNTTRSKIFNAFVCGPKYGFFSLKRSLFLTQNLLDILSPEEMVAVASHEAAHFKQHHVFKRAMAGFFLMLASALVVSTFFALIKTHSLLSSVFLCLIVQLVGMGRVIRAQEFEADRVALQLGATPQALKSALEKITLQNGGSRQKNDFLTRFMSGHFHPALVERLDAIDLEVARKTLPIPLHSLQKELHEAEASTDQLAG